MHVPNPASGSIILSSPIPVIAMAMSDRSISFSRIFSLRHAPLWLAVVLLAACNSTPVVYKRESFATNSPYQKKLEIGAASACEGARRALLGDGYVIDSANSDSVKGRKAYRSDNGRSTFIEMGVVCVPDPAGSTIYANGLLSTYEVRKSAASASVGVSAIGSLSLPFNQSADSMVKTSDETINDRSFYQAFFAAVDTILVEMQPDKAANAKPAAAKEKPIPASTTGPQFGGTAQPTATPGPTPAPQVSPAPAPTPLPTPASAPAPAATPTPAPDHK